MADKILAPDEEQRRRIGDSLKKFRNKAGDTPANLVQIRIREKHAVCRLYCELSGRVSCFNRLSARSYRQTCTRSCCAGRRRSYKSGDCLSFCTEARIKDDGGDLVKRSYTFEAESGIVKGGSFLKKIYPRSSRGFFLLPDMISERQIVILVRRWCVIALPLSE